MLSFANPWGLLALLAVPAIVAIHLYRRRFPRLPVAGTFLWDGATQRHDVGRTRDRLPVTPTLLLELLAATLLALVLAQPRWTGTGRVEHLIVVLDDSASMTAALPDGGTVRDAAIAEIAGRMESLGRRDVVTVVTTGRRPALLAGPAATWAEAEEPLRSWSPQAIQYDPAPAWDLASQLAGDEGRLLYLTDRLPEQTDAVPQAMEVVSLGRPAGNVALTAARWRIDPATGRGTISLRLVKNGSSAASVLLQGRSGEASVCSQKVDVPPNGSSPIDFEVPGGLGTLTVEAVENDEAIDDALAIDSIVTLVEPNRRVVRVAVDLPDEHAATGSLRRVLERLPAVEFVPVDRADLVVADGTTLPAADADLWWLGLGCGTATGDTSQNDAFAPPVDLAGPYVIDKRDPLTDGLSLEGVVWGGVSDVEMAVTPLVSGGPYPLLSRLAGTPTKAYLLNIDLSRSNLADSPDWPILIANLVTAVRDDQPGLRRWNFRSGETIAMRLPTEAGGTGAMLTLAGPDGNRPIARTRTIEITPPATPGVYSLRDGETSLGRFAVNFQDAVESDLTTRRAGNREPAAPVVARGVMPDTIYSWFVLGAIACVLAAVVGDWYVLQPKRGSPANHAGRRE